MAFTGIHVVCAYAGASTHRDKSQPIIGDIRWSESPSSGTPTTNVAAGLSDLKGDPIFRIQAAVDAWVSIGTSPDASTNPRFRVRAEDGDFDVFVEPGDNLAWQAA